jgi:hypothetical protein
VAARQGRDVGNYIADNYLRSAPDDDASEDND